MPKGASMNIPIVIAIGMIVLVISTILFGVMGIVERIFDALLFAFVVGFLVLLLKKASEK